MSMIQIIKQAALEAVRESDPTTVTFGTVTKADPLEVNVDQHKTLTKEFLLVPESLTKKEIELLQEKVVIREDLKVGDKVLLLRIQGGQKYIILDRLVSAT